MNDTSTTQTEQPPSGEPSGPRVTREDIKDLGRLRRSITDRHIAGVAGGLARHLDIDPIIVRVTLVVSAFFGGAGLLAYLGLWVLVPEEGTDDEPLGLDRRSRTVALAGVGLIAALAAIGDWSGAFWFPWQLALVAAGVVWLLQHQNKRTQDAPPAYPFPAEGADNGTDNGADSAQYAGAYAGDYTAQYASQYGGQYGGQYGSQYAQATTYATRPPRPRKRGPLLFFPTFALIALAEGVLGVVDLAGADITASAYPALALGITAAALLLGAFWGRAGGLIALGLIAAVATAGATLVPRVDDENHFYAPAEAGQVQDRYDFGGGRFTLDLSSVDDVDALGGRDIAINGTVGQVEVIVPDGLDVAVTSTVTAGDIRAFDRHSDGFDVTQNAFLNGGEEAPDLSLSVDLGAGEITVREAA